MSTQRQRFSASLRRPALASGLATALRTRGHRVRIGAPRRACRTATALALALGTAAGCAGRPALPDYPPGPGEGLPRRGGSVVLVRDEDPDYLDPALSYGTYSAPVTDAIFHTLIDYADARGLEGARLVPDLAERVPEVREAGTLYCMKLRADARFGAPLRRHITAADCKYSIERLFRVNSPGVAFYRNIVGADRVLAGQDSVITGVIARGDSLYLRLRQPDPVFPHLIAMTFTAPVPREVADRHPNDFSQHTVATGPYQLAEFIPRRRVLLTRNPDYCGAPGYLDTIEVRLGVNPTSAVAMVRRGLADGGFFEMPAAEFTRLKTDSIWRRQIDSSSGLETDYLFFNVRVKPFNDPRVRQAIGWALDRRALVKVWSGKAAVAGEFVPPTMPGSERHERYLGPDLGRARKLLREAGYPEGFSTRLFGATQQPIPRVMSVLQQQLAAIGVRVQLDLGEQAGYTAMAGDTANRVPFGWSSWAADYVDPSNFFDTLLNGLRIAANNNNNLSLFDDADVNDLIERAMATPDDSARARMWQEMERRVMDRAPVMPLVHVYESRLYGPRLGGWYWHITRTLKLEKLYRKQRTGTPALVSARPPAAAAGSAAPPREKARANQ